MVYVSIDFHIDTIILYFLLKTSYFIKEQLSLGRAPRVLNVS